MSMESSIILNIYSILILAVIFFHAIKLFEKDSLQDKLFMSILYVTAFMLFLDILSRLDGNSSAFYPVLNRTGNFLVFLLSPVIPSLWVAYVHFQVFHDEKRIKRLTLPLGIVNAVNAASMVFSLGKGRFYYIDSDNIYHRGPLFMVPVFITFTLLFAAFMLIFVNRKKTGSKKFLSLAVLTFVPFVSIFLQIKFYGSSIILNSIVLSTLVVFLNIQSQSMYTDHLTGVNNRKKLDAYLEKKVSLCTEGKSFSAILIDINDFKQINDTFGHQTGDIALETAVKLLKTCLRTGDFIARFGGDEFCIILDITDMNELEAVVSRINNRLEEYNKSGSSTFRLEFSMGFAVYDCTSHKNAAEFLERIDQLMYEDKLAYKTKTAQIRV